MGPRAWVETQAGTPQGQSRIVIRLEQPRCVGHFGLDKQVRGMYEGTLVLNYDGRGSGFLSSHGDLQITLKYSAVTTLRIRGYFLLSKQHNEN